MSTVSESSTSPETNRKLLDLSGRILRKDCISGGEIEECGFTGQLRTSLVESLIWAVSSDDLEVKALISVIFAQPVDVFGYLDGLLRENTKVLEKFISSGITRKLAIGEISPPRLSAVGFLNARQTVVCTISSVLHNHCEAILAAPATWRSTTQALTSGEDRAEMMALFLDELGVSARSRLSMLVYVWTQGNAEAVQAVHALSGTDEFDIVEAALTIDGVSDFPAYELIGISDLLRQILPNSSEGIALAMETFIGLLARAFELAAEHAEASESESAIVPQIVSLNLHGQFAEILRSRNWVIDPNFIDVSIFSEKEKNSTPNELQFDVRLKPCWFSVRVLVNSKEGEITLIKTTAGSPNSWPLWRVNSLTGLGGRTAHKDDKEDGVVFKLPSIPGTASEEIIINIGESDEIRLSVSWNSRIEKPAPVLTLQPTEINLPPTISSSMMRTIPLIPRPRLVLFFHAGESDPGTFAQNIFSRDLVTTLQPSNVAVRDLVREIHAHDTLVITESVVESSDRFVVGVAIGAGKIVQIVVGSTEVGDFTNNLVQQELATLVSL